MNDEKIRVGIIGAGGWAKYGHIPALQALKEGFEIVAVASRKKEQAEEYKAKFNLLHAFDDAQALIECGDVDLVVVVAPAPEHAQLVRAAITAGKDIYSEWPLTTTTPHQKSFWGWPKQMVSGTSSVYNAGLAHVLAIRGIW